MANEIQEWLRKKAHSDECGSPMEEVFLGALNTYGTTLPLVLTKDYRLKQQAWIEDYRADFLFVLVGSVAKDQPSQLVVEIDGHDFHERTKEQARHDKRRDRYMLQKGFGLMRFTGSEIHANPFGCVDEVFDRLCQMKYGMTPLESKARAIIDNVKRLCEED